MEKLENLNFEYALKILNVTQNRPVLDKILKFTYLLSNSR